MKQILVLGAGRSATVLINYLLQNAIQHNWKIIVADLSLELAKEKVQNHSHGEPLVFDINNENQRSEQIKKSDIVVSLLPPVFHIIAAKECIKYGKNMVTASYVSKEIAELDHEAIEKGIILLQEIGVDPGIDHMSAKREIDKIHKKGGKIDLFKSFTGGLVAPAYDNNPWGYKFTWNPMNVVVAGQSTAKFIRNGRYKYIPHHSLFTRIEEHEVLDYGVFEAYANRDSISYKDIYGISDVPTIFRGTFRKKGFCNAWNIFVELGMTDNTYEMENVNSMTWRSYINSFLVYDEIKTVEEKVCERCKLTLDSPEFKKLKWLGIFDDTPIGLFKGSPAEILLHLLLQKWSLEKGDKDMIVMQHIFEYQLNNEYYRLKSSLVVEGENDTETAMAKTVGLPAAIATKLILEGKIDSKGVVIPIVPQIYNQVLDELQQFGITFVDELTKV